MFDLACTLTLVSATLVVAIAYAGRLSRAGAATHARIDRAGSSPLLGKGLMEMGYWAMRPVARACILLGASANAVSWASLVLAGAAGIALALGHFGAGAVFSVSSSVCDALDGMIARETGTASDSGEVLDAAIDRYAEIFFIGGVVFHERSDAVLTVIALAALAGAFMVSYSTAKAEALQVAAPRGSMRRQERAVYLVLGAALVPVVTAVASRAAGPMWLDRVPLILALGTVAVVGNASAVRRLRAIAVAVRRLEPAHTPAPTDTDPIARNAHAAAGDAAR